MYAKEGWFEDPAGRHQYRWFSVGRPTSLVMDSHRTSQDPISIDDPAVFADLALDQPPDTAPLLHRDPPRRPIQVTDPAGFGTSGEFPSTLGRHRAPSMIVALILLSLVCCLPLYWQGLIPPGWLKILVPAPAVVYCVLAPPLAWLHRRRSTIRAPRDSAASSHPDGP